VDDADEPSAHGSDVVGTASQGSVELVVEQEEERHRIGAQIQFSAGRVRKAVGGELGYIPHRVPGQRLRAGAQPVLAHPGQVPPPALGQAGADAECEGKGKLDVLRHDASNLG
jgi:hypothetical protein